MSRNTIMTSEQKLKDATMISENVDPKQLLPIVKACQDRYIHSILGTALYNKILDEIDAQTLAGDYKTLVDDYVSDCLTWYVLKELPIPLNYKFVNKGLMTRTSEDGSVQDHLNTRNVTDWCNNWAEYYAERLIAHLCANYTLYPEYQNPGSSVDTIHPKKNSYSTPFALDIPREDARSFAEKYQGNTYRHE